MSKRILFIILAVAVCVLTVSAASFAADAKKPAMPPAPQGIKAQMPKPAFSVLNGTVSKIDTADPANIKIEVKNEADNTIRLISVTPMTNITKVTDVYELKTGDAVKIYSKKTDASEVAMGIMFGKLAARPTPRRAATAAAPQAAAPDVTKK